MGMSASQARLLSLTARLSDLEYQAQMISNSKIRLADEGAQASKDYELALDKKITKVENGTDGSFQDASVANVATYGGTSLDGTNSKFRYISDNAGNLVMTAAQARNLGLNVTQANDGSYSSTFNTNTYPTLDSYITYQRNQGRIGYTTTTTTAPATAGQGNSNTTNPTTGVITTVTVNNGTATTTVQTPNAQAIKYYSDLYSKLSATTTRNGAPTSTPQVKILTDSQASDPEWLERQIQSGGVYLSEFSENDNRFQNVSWTSGDNTINEQTDSSEMARAEAKYEATMADINAKDKRFDAELKTIDTEHQAVQTEIDSVKKVIDKNIERSFKIFQA